MDRNLIMISTVFRVARMVLSNKEKTKFLTGKMLQSELLSFANPSKINVILATYFSSRGKENKAIELNQSAKGQ